MKSTFGIGTLLVGLLFFFVFASAQNSTCDVRYGTFAGGLAFPISQQKGFLRLFNVSVCVGSITSSVVGYQDLSNGTYDMVAGATDNAYTRYFDFNTYRQNISLIAATGESNLQIIAGGASINRWEDFKNGTFVVDSATSGLVILLRRALAIRNLWFERGDFKFFAAGTSAARFQNIYDNTNGVVGGVLAVPYSANLLASNNTFYQGRVKAIGLINSEILPVQGSSFQSNPQTLNNQNKFSAISRLIAGYILGRRFLAQPENREEVLRLIRSQNTTQFEPAIQLIYNQSVDPVVGEVTSSLRFTDVALKNGFFLKEVFGGAPYNNTNYEPAFTTGRGRLIDYSALDAAEALFNKFRNRFTVNTAGLNVCATSLRFNNARFNVSSFVRSVVNKTSGGCTAVVTGRFLNCTSDEDSAPSNCVYDAPNDRLSVAFSSNPLTRTYNANVEVKDQCGNTRVVTRSVTVYFGLYRPGCTIVP